MPIHLQRDLDRLRKELLGVGALVEEACTKAVRALIDRREDLAAEVLEGDAAIDAREVEVEEECLKILALHQPVAGDLRFIVTMLKVNNDLERIGDLAVNLSERAAYLAAHEPLPVDLAFPAMAEEVLGMVRRGLEAVVKLDVELAADVIGQDDVVDRHNRDMFDVLQPLMVEDGQTVLRAVHALSAARHLERIADLATNVAEDVIFLVEGRVIRHHPERYE